MSVLRTTYIENSVDEKLRVKAFRENITKGDLMTKAIHQYFTLDGIPEIQLIIQNHEVIKSNPLLQSEWQRFCMFVKMAQTYKEDDGYA